MRGLLQRTVAALAICVASALLSTEAQASADSGCTTTWRTTQPDYVPCDSLMILAPGTDTRLSLLMLLLDQQGDTRMPVLPTDTEMPIGPAAGWTDFRDRFYPQPESDGQRIRGSADRCNSDASGAGAFLAALDTARRLPATEKAALAAARADLSDWCRDPGSREMSDTSPEVNSAPGRAFLAYLDGAKAFYSGDFDGAGAAFARIGQTDVAWLREAALYMRARALLNAAQVGIYGTYGYFDPNKPIAKGVADRNEAALDAYLSAYPRGRYAASAKGLLRRIYWLSNQRDKLTAAYDAAVREQAVSDPATFAEEFDLKLLAQQGAISPATPQLLAVVDLARMRALSSEDSYGGLAPECCSAPLTRAELDAQRPRFAGQEALYDLLIATHDFYVARRPQAVIDHIPAITGARRLTHIAFSRQYLRGLALDETRAAGAEAHWKAVIDASAPGAQRMTAELALAAHYERTGTVARAFATGSPVHIPAARVILLTSSADPALLRQQAIAQDASPRERSIAAFTLLYKRLTRGEYAEFGRDLAIIPADASPDEASRYWVWNQHAIAPVANFRQSLSDPQFSCPVLPQTVARLATAPRDPHASLCLADFMRLAGFDQDPLNRPETGPWLGGVSRPYDVGSYNRLDAYRRVMADRAAAPDDRAYALYRAVNCYAPSGGNSCGGEEATLAQRRGWFQQLKRDYPRSSWAQSLRYYW